MTETTTIQIPRTYAEAQAAGWRDWYQAYERSYTSRRTVLADQPIYATTCRRWRGETRYYVESPCWRSTMYGTVRVYLRPPQQ